MVAARFYDPNLVYQSIRCWLDFSIIIPCGYVR
jgi:hypothetical protein